MNLRQGVEGNLLQYNRYERLVNLGVPTFSSAIYAGVQLRDGVAAKAD
ncbi:hypothetical protein BVRB_1g014910 [Beta vulgaris subsp. vulgaris]|nr:hypothetical protein BVRB_1g014910 [Beta vulgaris subsp. vulgaris]